MSRRATAAANRIDAMTEGIATEPLCVQRRRESRKEEFTAQTHLAGLLARHLDPTCTFWTSLENKPLSRISGYLQVKRGVRSGLPDLEVIWRGKPIFIELKSRRGVASKAQKQIRLELLPSGAAWYMARSARAALMALHLEGVVFRRKWKPPRLKPWEGPFNGSERRLPQHPVVAAERAAACKRWRLRQANRARETAKLPNDDIAA
jgi:hypothetical protein